MRLFTRRMVEIANIRNLFNIISFRHIILLFAVLFVAPFLLSQENQTNKTGKKKIELIYADDDYIIKDPDTGKDMHRFIGQVHLKHNEITMWCDSAHYSPDVNQVTAFSKIHIVQGDTLDLFGDYLFYDGKSEMAFVKRNVVLRDKETHLYTEAIDYDVKKRIATYNTKGRITNADNTLTSMTGVYYVSDNLFHFKDSVKIVNPEYVMTADTMDYNTQTETSFFTGPTNLIGDSLNLYCEKGWYDTKNKITSIWKNAMIDNMQQVIHGDSLFYNDSIGYGEGYRHVVIEDTTNNIIIKGNYAWYFKQPEQFLVTDMAQFIQVSSNDSLFLHADTISSVIIPDSLTNGYRLMKAFYGCRIFSEGLQAKCDSLSYSFKDSVIRLYNKPVIWSEENQLTSDSMAVFTKNRKTERLELYNSAFVAIEVDTSRYHQIKGKSLTGYFMNNKLYKILIKGNGESFYYLLDGDDIAGTDHAKSADIEALIDNGKITEITITGSPEGIIDPPSLTIVQEIRLDGFSWLNHLRPKNRYDIFRK